MKVKNIRLKKKIQLEHPYGKKAPKIDISKYEAIRSTMVQILFGKELTYLQIFSKIEAKLRKSFSGSIAWYTEGVKLDLEARHLIERVPTSPTKYRII